MQMPVVVGVIVALMFLVTFSEWFYNIVAGWKEMLIVDLFINYRVWTAGIVSVVLFVGAFWVVATINECSSDTLDEERVGIFANLKCKEYLNLRTGAEQIFQGGEKTVDESL